MIQRIVKMQFKPDETDNFMAIFEEIKDRIGSFSGCQGVTLLRGKKDPYTFFTYSSWDAEADLEAYRSSDFFADTWTRTKKLFAEKAEAWTTEVIGGEP